MATITTNLTCDLKQPVSMHYIPGNMFSGDNGGNTINVYVTSDGSPVTLTEDVSATVIRSDGTTVALTGDKSSNRAYIILPTAAYAVPGVITIIIKLSQGTTVTTIAALMANVYQTTTATVINNS